MLFTCCLQGERWHGPLDPFHYHHSVLLFIFLIFPRIPLLTIPIKLSYKDWDLTVWHFCPSSFAKQNTKISNLFSCSPPVSPKVSRVVDTTHSSPTSALLPASNSSFILSLYLGIAGCQTAHRVAMCFPFLPQQVLCSSSRKHQHLGSTSILMQWTTSI